MSKKKMRRGRRKNKGENIKKDEEVNKKRKRMKNKRWADEKYGERE